MSERGLPLLFVGGLGLLVLQAACTKRSGSATPNQAASPHLVVAPVLVPNPNPSVPLAAVLSLTTDVPTQVVLRVSDGVQQWTEIAAREYRTVHDRVPVLGMRPGRAHRIDVTARAASGAETSSAASFTYVTPALPEGFPPISVTTSAPERMEPGVTLVTINAPDFGDVVVMLDAAGEVVWYWNDPLLHTPVYQTYIGFPLPNGNLMLMVGRRALREVDMLGDVVQTWAAAGAQPLAGAIALPLDSVHHDIVAMPEGDACDFVTLSTELRALPDYPTEISKSTTAPYGDVVGDKVVELRRDGTVVREFKLLDLLDPYRIGYDSLGSYWDDVYERATNDWSHANAVVYDARDDSYLVSVRHQDAVVKIARGTGAVQWILGDPTGWNDPWRALLLTQSGAGFAWAYHQHAPQIEPDGRLLVFDNGNQRAIPPAPPLEQSYSRAVEFRVDAQGRTVQQPWGYGAPPPGNPEAPSFLCMFAGSARHMPSTGNVLVCDGAKLAPNTNGPWFARVVEVTHTQRPEIVFEAFVRDERPQANSYWIYRAERLSGVYRR